MNEISSTKRKTLYVVQFALLRGSTTCWWPIWRPKYVVKTSYVETPLSNVNTTSCVWLHFTDTCDPINSTEMSHLAVMDYNICGCHHDKLTYAVYMHGSVHRESNLITVQQDASYSVYYISVGSSTCFGCWHPSSGARTTVITASGIN